MTIVQDSNLESEHEDITVEMPEVTPQNEATLLDDTHLFDDVPDHTVASVHEVAPSMDVAAAHEEVQSPVIPPTNPDIIIKTTDSTISTVSSDPADPSQHSGNMKVIFGVVFAGVILVIV